MQLITHYDEFSLSLSTLNHYKVLSESGNSFNRVKKNLSINGIRPSLDSIRLHVLV